MATSPFRFPYGDCLRLVAERAGEPAPGRVQLLTGPRQVGKTTLLLEIAAGLGPRAIYAAADGPEASTPGFWERLWLDAEERAREHGWAVVLLDEIHFLPGWASRLKAEWDRMRRRRIPVNVVATGSSALGLAAGSRESLAGRFERITLGHWSAASVARAFEMDPAEAADLAVRIGSYPGSLPLRRDPARWAAYVRDAIVEPAVGRDLLALAPIRRPALLRQVFAVCATSPAQIVSLKKLQGSLQDPGALATISHYLDLLEDAYLIAALRKHAGRPARRRSSPPKIVALSNALLAVTDPRGAPEPATDPARFGAWVENAVLAHAWNSGQQVRYWREAPLEVDGVIEGTWGRWAIEVKTGGTDPGRFRGLLEFTRRFPGFKPLVVGDPPAIAAAGRLGIGAMDWRRFLLGGPRGEPAESA
ncbi:MAG: ATP-binding protein [Acidobacteria bacterium]|nr:ATP-binding protein [Acidobacteriota bacterium]